MGGTAPDRFSPDLTTSRAMLITILYRMEGSPAVDDTVWGYPFADVAPDAWYAEPVYWARMTGVMTGYSDEVFGPDDPVTREQMAAILYRYAQYKGVDTTARADLSRYSDDGQISTWAKDAFSWVNARGIINGTGDGVLSPKTGATRAQTAQILMNYQNIR